MLASGTIAKTLTSLKNQAESLASGRRHIAVLSHCLVLFLGYKFILGTKTIWNSNTMPTPSVLVLPHWVNNS